MNAPPVRPGDILARKYRVERVLGAGGMGVVVAATHVELGQVVALKHMLCGKDASTEQRERFLREARAAVRLKSHHVARVLDVGADEDHAPYIVMEFLEGQDLAALLAARGQLPFEEAAAYVLQACEAVGEAHAAGIVHRDLKPANLFLTHDVSGAPCVKVLDFGISKLAGTDLALTSESQALGSPLYMSPEQMSSSKSVDQRSDIWALGIILYQLVAGSTPFHADTLQALCARVLTGAPTPLGHHRNDAPPGFEALLLRCLERDRDRRFRDVAELAAAMAAYAPPHARVYAERVARVVNMKGARAGSAPELPPAPMVTAAVAPAPQTTARLPHSPAPVEAIGAAPNMLLPRAAEPGAPVLGTDTALLLSSPHDAAASPPREQERGAKARARLVVAGALVLVAATAAIAVALGKSGTGAGEASPAPASSAEPAASVAAPSVAAPLVPAKIAETTPPTEATSSARAPASATIAPAPAPSSTQRSAPVKQPGTKAKPAPAPVENLYSR
jgi:serine/threonine-protein kinase